MLFVQDTFVTKPSSNYYQVTHYYLFRSGTLISAILIQKPAWQYILESKLLGEPITSFSNLLYLPIKCVYLLLYEELCQGAFKFLLLSVSHPPVLSALIAPNTHSHSPSFSIPLPPQTFLPGEMHSVIAFLYDLNYFLIYTDI